MTPTSAASQLQRRARMSREARRDQLLDIAVDLFTERGYEAASMDELARRAGISKPIVYDHFGSKDGVFQACVERIMLALTERVAEATTRTRGPEQVLRAGSLAFFEFMREHHGAMALFDPSRNPGAMLKEQATRVRLRQSHFMAAAIVSSSHELGAEVDPVRVDAIAYAMTGAYEALARWWGEHPDHSAAEISDWLVDFVWPGLVRLINVAAG